MNYKDRLEKWSIDTRKIRITWNELQELLDIEDYKLLVKEIELLVNDNTLKKVGSKKNGRYPQLYSKYEVVKPEKDYTYIITEINNINDKLNKSFYLRNPESYIVNRNDILMINNYITNSIHLLDTKISINERSFEIFWKEKYLKEKGVKSILKNLGLNEDFLNYYETTEAIAYYSINKKMPQNILIIENKDTFYSIRKYLKETGSTVFGVEISTVIYGAGKGRLPSFNEINEYTESHIANPQNTFYYFGDLDYEGISIFENYVEKNKSYMDIQPFTRAYEYILEKSKNNIDMLPLTKEGQKNNLKGAFFQYFDAKFSLKILDILDRRKYIPQEALNYNDLLNNV